MTHVRSKLKGTGVVLDRPRVRWHGGRVSVHSPRVVAAESAAEIAAAVDCAREHGSGLGIKGRENPL